MTVARTFYSSVRSAGDTGSQLKLGWVRLWSDGGVARKLAQRNKHTIGDANPERFLMFIVFCSEPAYDVTVFKQVTL